MKVAITTLVALIGCASGGLPYPRWADVGRQWGCDPLQVQQRNVALAQQRPAGTREVEVQVGWDACEMLAQSGEPAEVRSVATTDRRSYSLIYMHRIARQPHLVTLEQDQQQVWRVTAVVW